MNHMKEVAQLLGVELEEEFKIEDYVGDYRYKLTEEHLMHTSNGKWHTLPATITYLLNGKCKVIKIPKPILDEVEKRYLSRVIRPWRDKVEYIRKINFDDEDEFIVIIYRERESKAMPLPCFKKGTMYKGMEVGKEYSLEDLGL